MTVRLYAEIPGTPQQQGSKRLTNGHMIETNRRLAPWRADAIHAIQEAMASTIYGGDWPLTEAVHVGAYFYFIRPKSHYGTGRNSEVLKGTAPDWRPAPPDLDKLQRALGDALTQAGAIRDDALIVSWFASKRWCTGRPYPHTIVRIEMAL